MHPNTRRRRAFTLVELIAAIVILGLLAGVVVASGRATIRRSQDEAALLELAALEDAARSMASFEARAIAYSDFLDAPATAAEQTHTAGIEAIAHTESSEQWGTVSLGVTAAQDAVSMAMRSRSGRCALYASDGVDELVSEAVSVEEGGCRADAITVLTPDPDAPPPPDGGPPPGPGPGGPSGLSPTTTGGVAQLVVEWAEPTTVPVSYRLGYTDQHAVSSVTTTDAASVCTGGLCSWTVAADDSRLFNVVLSGTTSAGDVLVSPTMQATTAPAPPVPSATSTAGAITIDWDDVELADSYAVERGPDATTPPAAWTSVTCADATASQCTDTAVADGETWFYWVTASNASGGRTGGPADATVTSSAMTIALGASGQTTTVELTWPDEPLATSYQLRRSEAGAGLASAATIVTLPSGATSHTDTPPVPGRDYDYWLTGDDGTATQTDGPATAATAPAAPPVAATATSADTVTVTITAVEGAEQYLLQRSDDGSSGWSDLGAWSASTTRAQSGLAPGTTHHYRARARNATGAGPFGAPDSVSLADPLGAPTLAASSAPTSADLTWAATTGTPASYLLQVSPAGAATWSTAYSGTGTTHTETPIARSTALDWRVRASDASGDGPWSPVRTSLTVPAAPSPATATVTGPGQVTLTWTAPGLADDYTVEVATDDGTGFSAWTTVGTTTATSATYTGLADGVAHRYRVLASNTTGDGPYATASDVETGPAAPSLTAATVAAHGDGAIDDVDLTWTQPAGTLDRYEVARCSATADGAACTPTTVWSTAASPAAGTLDADQPYDRWRYRVRAVNTGGTTSGWSTTEQADVVVPLTATAAAASVDLDWDRVVGATEYVVRRCSAPSCTPSTVVATLVESDGATSFETTPEELWVQDIDDDIDFTRQSGPTASSSTGPTAAHDATTYLYTEASGAANLTARLRSDNPLTVGAGSSISFARHMYGTATGTLRLQASTDEATWADVWSLTGDQGDAWVVESVDLSAYAGQQVWLRFAATTGSSFTSDIAIDAITTTAMLAEAPTSHRDRGLSDTTTYTYTVTPTPATLGGTSAPASATPLPDPPLLATYDTRLAPSVGDAVVRLPITGVFDVTVDWGDGTAPQDFSTGTVEHTYATPGVYQVAVTGETTQFDSSVAGVSGEHSDKLLSVEQWGDLEPVKVSLAGSANLTAVPNDTVGLETVTDMSAMFENATSFNAPVDGWDLSAVTDTSRMFRRAPAFNQPIGSWSMSNVTTVEQMFEEATAFDQPIGSWDVSAVTDMRRMFFLARAFDQPIGSWDVSAVTDMSSLLHGASLFDQPLDSWNVSSVTTTASMFDGASAFAQPIGSWDVSAVTDMSEMFSAANAFDQPLGTWNTAAVTDMNGMFDSNTTFNQPIGSWDVSAVTDMSSMFQAAAAFNQPLGSWDTAAVVDMEYMFQAARAFDQPLGSWTTTAVTDMDSMFYNASAFNQPLDTWDVSAVTDMHQMFVGAVVFDQPLGTWDTGAVTRMSSMFSGASAFNQPLGGWDTAAVTDMSSMFRNAPLFDQPLGTWNTGAVTDMSEMFSGATAFNQPIGTWDTAAVTDMRAMFLEAVNFDQTLDSWDVSAVTDMSYMFYRARVFNSPVGAWTTTSLTTTEVMFFEAALFDQPIGGWDTSSVTTMRSMFFRASSFNQPLNSWDVSSVTNFGNMFRDAPAFNRWLDNWQMTSATSTASMFYGADSFNGLVHTWDVSNVTVTASMFRGALAFNRDITAWDVSSVTDFSRMFQQADSFGQPIIAWDTSAATDMTAMFYGADTFARDLSGWPVALVTSCSNFSPVNPASIPPNFTACTE